MKKYNKSDLIQDLEISIRSKNALQSENIKTVEDLLNYSEKKLYNIQNLGKKSIDELLEIMNSFKKKYSCLNQKKFFVSREQKKYVDYEIDELELSVRSKNALKRENINFLSQILILSEDEIEKIKNLGEKSKVEISNFQKEIVLEEANENDEYSQEFKEFIEELEKDYSEVIFLSQKIVDEIHLIFLQEKNRDRKSVV